MGMTYPGMHWDGRERFQSTETTGKKGRGGGTAHLSIGRYDTDIGSKMTLATSVKKTARNYKTAMNSNQKKLTYHTIGMDPQMLKGLPNRCDYDTNRLDKASLAMQVYVSSQKYSNMRSKSPRFTTGEHKSSHLGPGAYEKNDSRYARR
jgi:hypothetical protein